MQSQEKQQADGGGAMNFYPHHIGDYRSATSHLSNEEDLAYRRLLEMYYDTEQPIPADTQWVSRRLRVATCALAAVLADFFFMDESGYRHARCDAEIADYRRKSDISRENGKKGGRRKSLEGQEKNPAGSCPVSDGLANRTQPLANQEPVTKNQEPETSNQKKISPTGLSAEPPSCPHEAIIALYHEVLPELDRVRVWHDRRRKSLQARWREDTDRQDLGWWRDFFVYVRRCPFLMGDVPASDGRHPFSASLEWLLLPTNFAKVIEGRYEGSAR